MNKTLYCPVGEPQRKFGVYVTGAGQEITKPGEPYPHAYHSSDYYFTWDKGRALADWEYQILYIRSGRGVIEFQRGKRIHLKAGSLIRECGKDEKPDGQTQHELARRQSSQLCQTHHL